MGTLYGQNYVDTVSCTFGVGAPVQKGSSIKKLFSHFDVKKLACTAPRLQPHQTLLAWTGTPWASPTSVLDLTYAVLECELIPAARLRSLLESLKPEEWPRRKENSKEGIDLVLI